MDRFLDAISSYATALTYESLPPEAVHETKRRTIDVLGCALGAYGAPPVAMARAQALEAAGTPGATVIGTRHRSSPDLATFANSVAGRYLDFNDCLQELEPGHPSDNIPAMFAIGEYVGADGKSVLNASVAAYEVQGCLAEVGRLKDHGWDHVGFVAIASAVGAGTILGLSKDRMANAIALGTVPNNALRQTRRGQLSMWKGCAAGNACRNGVFAALVASRGMTGPPEAFEGPMGYLKQVTGPIELPRFAGNGKPYKVQQTKLKFHPSDYEVQCMVNAALDLKDQIDDVRDIESVRVDTYQFAIDVAAESREKWSPTTRETADHSIPYALAVVLTDGRLWLDSFTEERIQDPAIRDLMQRIEVHADPECTAEFPDANDFKLEAVTKSGARYRAEVHYAKGHPKNPISDDEINAKFRRLAEPILGDGQIDKALARLWHFDEVTDLTELVELLAVDSPEGP